MILLGLALAVFLVYLFRDHKTAIHNARPLNNSDELKNQLFQCENQLRDVRIGNAALIKENTQYSNTCKGLKLTVDAKIKEIDNLRIALSNKSTIIQKLNFENNELKDSLKSAKDEVDHSDFVYSELYEKNESCQKEIEKLNNQIDSFDEIINNKNPFDYVAHLRSHALEHLSQYSDVNIEELATLFKYQYKFEYLLSIYPELQVYKEDDAYIKYKEDEDTKCNIKNWLTDEEYNQLSEVEREQLAVDRYVTGSSKWSDWEKGRNYEIYCAYILYNEGYDIIQEGLNKKLEDKGRDIIAVHRDTGKTLIVQCKNWTGYVRENIVFQLFGSYAQWLVDNNKKIGDVNVEAWLYLTGHLSAEAERCATMLNIHIRYLPMDMFPAIKCNVNHNTGQLIYHLPFDRHYDLVKINAKGKGYKFSIVEAIKEGFRRAYNH